MQRASPQRRSLGKAGEEEVQPAENSGSKSPVWVTLLILSVELALFACAAFTHGLCPWWFEYELIDWTIEYIVQVELNGWLPRGPITSGTIQNIRDFLRYLSAPDTDWEGIRRSWDALSKTDPYTNIL